MASVFLLQMENVTIFVLLILTSIFLSADTKSLRHGERLTRATRHRRQVACKPVKERELIKLLGREHVITVQQHTPMVLCAGQRNRKRKIVVLRSDNGTVIGRRKVWNWVIPSVCSHYHLLSDVGSNTRCPWRSHCSVDVNRYPPVLHSATCRNRPQARIGHGALVLDAPCKGGQYCTSVETLVWVMRKDPTRCDRRGREVWNRHREEVAVGCGCPWGGGVLNFGHKTVLRHRQGKWVDRIFYTLESHNIKEIYSCVYVKSQFKNYSFARLSVFFFLHVAN